MVYKQGYPKGASPEPVSSDGSSMLVQHSPTSTAIGALEYDSAADALAGPEPFSCYFFSSLAILLPSSLNTSLTYCIVNYPPCMSCEQLTAELPLRDAL